MMYRVLSIACLLSAPSASATMMIIIPDQPSDFIPARTITETATGNGSFEGGSTSGWVAFNNTSHSTTITSENGAPPGGSEGTHYLRLSTQADNALVRSRVDHRRRNIGLNGLADGDVFKISFDLQIPSTAGYHTLVVQPLTNIGPSLVENSNPFVDASLVTDQWTSYTTYYQASIDGFTGLDLRLILRHNIAGTTYEGFIDNVVIQQGSVIPEPSSFWLFGFGALGLCWRRATS